MSIYDPKYQVEPNGANSYQLIHFDFEAQTRRVLIPKGTLSFLTTVAHLMEVEVSHESCNAYYRGRKEEREEYGNRCPKCDGALVMGMPVG